jgi:hypothetical protein
MSVVNNTLKDSNGNIITFNPFIYDYYVTDSNSDIEIVYNQDTTYTVTNAGKHKLNMGTNTIPVTVTDTLGNVDIYRFIIDVTNV